MLANDEVTQNIAQAAAWNVADELSWDFLLTKNRVERMDGYYERFFSRDELAMAQRVVTETQTRAEAIEEEAAPSETNEVSQGEMQPADTE